MFSRHFWQDRKIRTRSSPRNEGRQVNKARRSQLLVKCEAIRYNYLRVSPYRQWHGAAEDESSIHISAAQHLEVGYRIDQVSYCHHVASNLSNAFLEFGKSIYDFRRAEWSQ